MSLPLLLLATVAGLLALAFWWLRPILQSMAAELAATPQRTREVTPGLADPDCGIGIALMASAADGGGGSAPAKRSRRTPDGDAELDALVDRIMKNDPDTERLIDALLDAGVTSDDIVRVLERRRMRF